MDVVGVHIIGVHQHRRAAQQPGPRRSTFAVRRVNAGDAQHMHPRAGGAAHHAEQAFGMHAALGPGGLRVDGAGFVNPVATAVAIHPAGAAVHQHRRQRTQPQGPKQRRRARISRARGWVVGRWSQMHQVCGQPGEAAQTALVVQVAHQRRDVVRPQLRHAVGRRGERQHMNALRQTFGHPQANVTTANDEHTGTAKARRQRAKGALV